MTLLEVVFLPVIGLGTFPFLKLPFQSLIFFLEFLHLATVVGTGESKTCR